MDVQTSPPPESTPPSAAPARCPCCSKTLAVVAVVLWLVAIAIAFKFDARIANSVERFTTTPKGVTISIGILSKFTLPAKIIRIPGTFPFTLVIAALLFFFHPWRWKGSAMLILAGIIGGIIYAVTKWTVGRERPEVHAPYVFNHFSGGFHGFLYAERLSFPSGHAMLAFATAMVLSLCIPRWWVLFFVLAAVVGAERVLEHSHYLSDVVAGAGVGVISALLAKRVITPKMACKSDNI